MAWKDLVSGTGAEVEFRAPALRVDVDAAGPLLGDDLPGDLRDLLVETNGILDDTGADVIWPLDHIVVQNRKFRSDPSFADLYMPFDSLLFFGDNGGGDHFALVIHPAREDVFVWKHENDSRQWVARTLQDYLGRRLRGDGDDWYADR